MGGKERKDTVHCILSRLLNYGPQNELLIFRTNIVIKFKNE